MSVIVDTGVLYAYLNPKDAHYERAQAVMQSILEGQYGTPIGTDTVLDEGLTLLLRNFPVRAVAEEYANWFWGTRRERPMLKLVHTTEALLREATDLYFRLHKRGLSFTDCTLMVHAEHRNARVATFDSALKFNSDGLDI